MGDKELVKMRDTLRAAADTLDEFLDLEQKKKDSADVSSDCERIIGKFMIQMTELQKIQSET